MKLIEHAITSVNSVEGWKRDAVVYGCVKNGSELQIRPKGRRIKLVSSTTYDYADSGETMTTMAGS